MSDLRAIEIGRRARRLRATAPRPEVAWVPIDRIRIDDSYQRPLLKRNWKSIEAIAAAFDWARFTPALVAPIEGGLYALIDGQHRAHAAFLAGFDHIPAMIVPMSHVDQARSFSWVNGNVTAITGFHIYKAALAAGEPWALESRAAVAAAGCTLMTFNKSAAEKKPGEVFCIKLIRNMVQEGTGNVVTIGLRAIRDDAEIGALAEAYTNGILRPWLQVLASNNQFLRLDLAAFLNGFDLISARDDAQEARRRDRSLSAVVVLRRSIAAALTEFRAARRSAAGEAATHLVKRADP